MLRRELDPSQNYENIRGPMKRKCVKRIRGLAVAIGYNESLLIANKHFRDAVKTLVSMSFSPAVIAIFVARPQITEALILDAIRVEVLQIILSIKEDIHVYLN